MDRIKALSKHREFMRHVATLLSGKAAAAAVAIVTMPLVARLFTPVDFGVAAVYVSVISLASRAASLRYELAIVLPEDEHEALKLMSLSYRLLLATCLIVLVLLAIHEVSFVKSSTIELLERSSWLVPLGVFLMGAIQIQENWLTRTKSFKVASVSLVTGNATTSASRIGFGFASGSSASGLIIGHLLGMVSRLAVQKEAVMKGFYAIRRYNSWPETKVIAQRYADFPKLNAPAAMIFTLGQNLPVLLFGVIFSPAVAGFYAMANQLARAPINMVAQSTRRVFLQKASSINNEGRSLRKSFLLTTAALALLGIPALLLILYFGQPLTTWFLGNQWENAGRYLEIIAPWLFMLWVMAPCNPVFIVLREQRFWLLLQILLTIMRIGVFGVAYVIEAGPEWTLQTFVLVTIIGNVVTWLTGLALISRHAHALRSN